MHISVAVLDVIDRGGSGQGVRQGWRIPCRQAWRKHDSRPGSANGSPLLGRIANFGPDHLLAPQSAYRLRTIATTTPSPLRSRAGSSAAPIT